MAQRGIGQYEDWVGDFGDIDPRSVLPYLGSNGLPYMGGPRTVVTTPETVIPKGVKTWMADIFPEQTDLYEGATVIPELAPRVDMPRRAPALPGLTADVAIAPQEPPAPRDGGLPSEIARNPFDTQKADITADVITEIQENDTSRGGGVTAGRGSTERSGGTEGPLPASLETDAQEAERQLSGPGGWLRGKASELFGMDDDQLDSLGAALIRAGGTMMVTPGNFGEALGAGILEGSDAYVGDADRRRQMVLEEEEREMRREEFEFRKAAAARARTGDGTAANAKAIELLSKGYSPEAIEAITGINPTDLGITADDLPGQALDPWTPASPQGKLYSDAMELMRINPGMTLDEAYAALRQYGVIPEEELF